MEEKARKVMVVVVVVEPRGEERRLFLLCSNKLPSACLAVREVCFN